MKNKVQFQNFLNLIKIALHIGDIRMAKDSIDGPDWPLLYQWARRHNVINIIYQGIQNISIEQRPTIDLMKKWQMTNDQNIMQYLYQEEELENLKQAFEQAEIPMILLKGAVLRELYPLAGLRTMADIDLQIHEEDVYRTRKIIQKLGYTVVSLDWREEDTFNKESYVTLEVHRRFYWKSELWAAGLHSFWTRAEPIRESSFCFLMKPEDFYIHLLGHIVHHMEIGGIGIRAFLDLWIYSKHYEQAWDTIYLMDMLNKLGLVKFHQCVKKLLDIWFNGEKMEAIYEEWTTYIMNSGAYGTSKYFIVHNAAMKEMEGKFQGVKKFQYIWRRLFPSYTEMCNTFPKISKNKWKYPFYCGKRIIKGGIMRFPEMKAELQSVKKADEKEIHRVRKLYEDIGISFKEK